MLVYFVIFVSVGAFLAYDSRNKEAFWYTTVGIAVMWSLIQHPIWGVVSFVEMLIGYFLIVYVFKSGRLVENHRLSDSNQHNPYSHKLENKEVINNFDNLIKDQDFPVEVRSSSEGPEGLEEYLSVVRDENDLQENLVYKEQLPLSHDSIHAELSAHSLIEQAKLLLEDFETEEAIKLLKIAAEKEEGFDASLLLAEHYEDEAPGFPYLERACEKGSGEACFKLSYFFEEGWEPVQQDAYHAAELIQRAADLGCRYSEVLRRVKQNNEDGFVSGLNPNNVSENSSIDDLLKVASWFANDASFLNYDYDEDMHVKSLLYLDYALKKGAGKEVCGFVVEHNFRFYEDVCLDKTLSLLLKATQLGWTDEVVELLEQKQISIKYENPEKYLLFLESLSGNGTAWASLKLYEEYYYGFSVSSDKKTAFSWAIVAMKQGADEAFELIVSHISDGVSFGDLVDDLDKAFMSYSQEKGVRVLLKIAGLYEAGILGEDLKGKALQVYKLAKSKGSKRAESKLSKLEISKPPK